MTYLINLLIIPIYYLIIHNVIKDKQKANKRFAIIVGIHAVLFRAFANPYNYSDTTLYDEGFRSISQMTFQEAIMQLNFYTHWGTGFLLFNWIIGQFTDNSQYMFALAAAASIVPIIWFYYKTSHKIILSLIIFLVYPMMYYMGFGVIRQHMSVAYILLALYYVDKLKVSIPLALIAFSLHTSGIVFFPFFIWKRINIQKIGTSRLIFYLLLFLVLFRTGMSFVLSFMPKYEEIVGGEADNNYIPALWMSALCIVSFASQLRNKITTKVEENVLSFFYYGVLISIFSIGLSGMGRFTICFLYIIPIITSYLIYQVTFGVKLATILINLVIIIRQLYYAIAPEQYTYTFFWEPATW